MENFDMHYRKVEKLRTFPRVRLAFENSGSVGASGLAALRVQLLKREEELDAGRSWRIQNVDRTQSDERAQLQENMPMPLWIQGY